MFQKRVSTVPSDFLSRFFAALGKQGYWVRLAESGEGLHSQDIDIKEEPKGEVLLRQFMAALFSQHYLHWGYAVCV